MAKKATGSVKLQIAAGKATPAPPVGPALGQAQINIMEFCKQFNARTSQKELEGLIIPVVVTVYNDRSFTFITKTPPASILLKRAAGIAKGSGAPNKDKVGKVTLKQVEDIAKQKMPDLNAASIDAAFKSGIFCFAISSTCFSVTFPTLSLFGAPDPLAIPAALFNRIEAGGVLVMNVNERSL